MQTDAAASETKGHEGDEDHEGGEDQEGDAGPEGHEGDEGLEGDADHGGHEVEGHGGEDDLVGNGPVRSLQVPIEAEKLQSWATGAPQTPRSSGRAIGLKHKYSNSVFLLYSLLLLLVRAFDRSVAKPPLTLASRCQRQSDEADAYDEARLTTGRPWPFS